MKLPGRDSRTKTQSTQEHGFPLNGMKPIRRCNRTADSQTGGFILRQRKCFIIKKKTTACIIALLFLAGCRPQTDPRDTQNDWPAPDPNSPLIGTRWSGGGRGGGGVETLYFESAEQVILNEKTANVLFLRYHYDKKSRRGYVNTLGNFTVTTEGYEKIDFPAWKQYPCGADFSRVYQ